MVKHSVIITAAMQTVGIIMCFLIFFIKSQKKKTNAARNNITASGTFRIRSAQMIVDVMPKISIGLFILNNRPNW
jgi:hypothetical protein